MEYIRIHKTIPEYVRTENNDQGSVDTIAMEYFFLHKNLLVSCIMFPNGVGIVIILVNDNL